MPTNDTQLRAYALENAKAILGAAPLGQILQAAQQIYDFLTDVTETEPTRH